MFVVLFCGRPDRFQWLGENASIEVLEMLRHLRQVQGSALRFQELIQFSNERFSRGVSVYAQDLIQSLRKQRDIERSSFNSLVLRINDLVQSAVHLRICFLVARALRILGVKKIVQPLRERREIQFDLL